MKLGELFIELGVVGDTKELSKALKQMKKAEGVTKTRQKIEKQLGRSLKANEVNVIKNAYALGNMVTTTMKVAAAIGGTVIALDRMAQSMIRVNQSFVGFSHQTGISINKANKFVSALGLLAGTKSESVLGDMTNLSQALFKIPMGEGDTKIFQMMGFNPLGMKTDQLLMQLRAQAKANKYNEEQLTYIVDSLGLSRDWVELLTASSDLFERIMKDSEGLQLSEEQRLKLQELSYQNRLQHAKLEKEILELQIKLLPFVNGMLGLVNGIAGAFKECGMTLVGVSAATIGWASNLKPVSKAFLKIYKTIAKIPIVGKMILPYIKALGFLGKTLLAPLGIILTIVDIVKGFVEFLNGQQDSWWAKLFTFVGGMFSPKGSETDKPVWADPVQHPYLNKFYEHMQTTMTNNFYNNPVPADEVVNQLGNITNANLAMGGI